MDHELDGEDAPPRLAIFNIDILATSLPPTHVIPPLLEQFPELVRSDNPNKRRAAMAAIGVIMEGAAEFMTTYIEELLPYVFSALRDSESIVVRAALIALSQITDELPTEVANHHSALVPEVFELLHSSNMEIMQAACNSLDSILEWIPRDAVAQYVPKLMEALIFIMSTDVDSDVKRIVASITCMKFKLTFSCHWDICTCFNGGLLSISGSHHERILFDERCRGTRRH